MAQEKKSEKGEPGYYAILPASVRYDDRLRANGKLLYAEITALAGKTGVCWADVPYFAKLYKVTERCIQRLLAQLEEYGYIRMDVTRKGNQYQGGRREIFLTDTGLAGLPKSAILRRKTAEEQKVVCSPEGDAGEQKVGADEQKIRAGEQIVAAILNNNNIINPPISPPGGECVPQGKSSDAKFKPERFEGFWKFYRSCVPKDNPVGGKQRAAKAWDKLRPTDGDIAAMGKALRATSKDPEWQRGIGVPHASTWLNQRRWEDLSENGTKDEDEPKTEQEGVAQW